MMTSIWLWVGVMLAYAAVSLPFFNLAKRNEYLLVKGTSDILFWIGVIGCMVSCVWITVGGIEIISLLHQTPASPEACRGAEWAVIVGAFSTFGISLLFLFFCFYFSADERKQLAAAVGKLLKRFGRRTTAQLFAF